MQFWIDVVVSRSDSSGTLQWPLYIVSSSTILWVARGAFYTGHDRL